MSPERENLPSLGSLFQCSDILSALTPHAEVELLVFWFMAFAPRPVTAHHQKESGTILSAPAFECISETPSHRNCT